MNKYLCTSNRSTLTNILGVDAAKRHIPFLSGAHVMLACLGVWWKLQEDYVPWLKCIYDLRLSQWRMSWAELFSHEHNPLLVSRDFPAYDILPTLRMQKNQTLVEMDKVHLISVASVDRKEHYNHFFAGATQLMRHLTKRLELYEGRAAIGRYIYIYLLPRTNTFFRDSILLCMQPLSMVEEWSVSFLPSWETSKPIFPSIRISLVCFCGGFFSSSCSSLFSFNEAYPQQATCLKHHTMRSHSETRTCIRECRYPMWLWSCLLLFVLVVLVRLFSTCFCLSCSRYRYLDRYIERLALVHNRDVLT
jgi:hypothetical protein